MTNQKDRLLTWEEWLNEKEGNIPFGKLDSLIQATMKAQYKYDRRERLAQQDTKSVKAMDRELFELLTSTCPHDKKGFFPQADCSLCVWELVEALKRSIDDGGERYGTQ